MIKNFEEAEVLLGPSAQALIALLNHIRTQYAMDESWDGKDELKFRRGGKTLATVYLREGYFTLLLIFGRQEQEAFEAAQQEFSPFLREIYRASKTYHDGKWMFIDVREEELVGQLIRMLHIKKKPNRKKENLKGAILGKCGHRCDQCLIYAHNTTPDARQLFQQSDFRCYGSEAEGQNDYSQVSCPGCKSSCEISVCAQEHGVEGCLHCDYSHCTEHAHKRIIPGRCNLGISNEDIERVILPYCGRQRLDAIRKQA